MMEQYHINKLLPEYLEGRLDNSREKMVEEHLEKCSLCKTELRELEILFKVFENEKEIEPSASLRIEFEKMLEKEKHEKSRELKTIPIKNKKRSNSLQNLLKIAAVLSLLLCSYLLGKFHQTGKATNAITESNELGNQEKEMLALLNNNSASKRIKGVYYVEELPNLDLEIIEALAERMLNDENENVRLAAVEALSRFTASEDVKDDFIDALKTEKAPVVQIAIIQTLVKIQEKKAADAMKDLLQKNSTEPFVKEQIEALLPSIT